MVEPGTLALVAVVALAILVPSAMVLLLGTRYTQRMFPPSERGSQGHEERQAHLEPENEGSENEG